MALSFPRGSVVLGVLAFTAGSLAQQLPWQHDAQKEADPVVYQYPEQITLTRGKPSTVELHFRIRDGLHINSHAPSDKSLIRTELIVAEPSGLDVQAVTFPEGTAYSSRAFPDQKLNVYAGELVLQAHLVATRPGEQLLNAALRYQACDADSCFPPKKASVVIGVVVH